MRRKTGCMLVASLAPAALSLTQPLFHLPALPQTASRLATCSSSLYKLRVMVLPLHIYLPTLRYSVSAHLT